MIQQVHYPADACIMVAQEILRVLNMDCRLEIVHMVLIEQRLILRID